MTRPANHTQRARFLCIDCQYDTWVDEYYAVGDDVWPLEPHGGMLCIECLEKRIGRTLVPDDFFMVFDTKDHPCSPRLAEKSKCRENFGHRGEKP